jgi:hypothetical protein
MTAPGGLRPVRGWACLGLLLGLALQPWLLHAGTPPAKGVEPADEDLLEFLGSVDSDDLGWKQYLASKDAQPPAAKKPPPAPPPSSAPAKNDGNKDEH